MAGNPVLQVRVDLLDRDPPVTSVCPGYEQGRWRAKELARDVFDRHLTTFALSYTEYVEINHESAAQSLRKAAQAIYNTQKYSKRGEFGELLLHSVIRDFYKTEPAISKIHFKDAPNDTVKGFDAVHVVEIENNLELWLGEVKFYEDLARAIRDVTEELHAHLKSNYLRGEFVAIVNKVDPGWKHAERIAQVLDQNTSLDEIFDAITIPVLLTYDSEAVGSNERVCQEYVASLRREAVHCWTKFHKRCDDSWNVKLRLLLLPMLKKAELVTLLHERLNSWQHL